MSVVLTRRVGVFFFFQAEDGIRDWSVTGVQTCALPISNGRPVYQGTGHTNRSGNFEKIRRHCEFKSPRQRDSFLRTRSQVEVQVSRRHQMKRLCGKSDRYYLRHCAAGILVKPPASRVRLKSLNVLLRSTRIEFEHEG